MSSTPPDITLNGSSYLPEIPTSGDIYRAIKSRFDEDNIFEWLLSLRPEDGTTEGRYPPVQKDEAEKGTPYPYVVVEVGKPASEGASSNRTAEGPTGEKTELRFELFATPFLLRVHSGSDDQAESVCKRLARSIERSDLKVCGGQKFVKLSRMTPLIPVKEGDKEWSYTARYDIQTETETI